MAALIGSRSLLYIISHLAEEHKIHLRKTYLWSDSRCVLYWLKDETKLLKRFIENRVTEIRKCKAIFRYVPSEFNPADIPSRGAMPRALSESTLWWNGPKFLVETEKDWPKNEVPDQSHDEDEFENWEEVSKNCKLFTANIKSYNFQTIQLYDPKYFDSWKILNRSIAYVLTFLKQIFEKSKAAQNFFKTLRLNTQSMQCTAFEIVAAERIIIKQCQCQNPPTEKEIQDLNLVVDNDGILLCRGRIENLKSRLPAFLPQKSTETILLIIDSHIRVMHAGTQATLAFLRNSYWIPRGRSQVKLVIRYNCFICRRYNAKPFALPKMADLPFERVEYG